MNILDVYKIQERDKIKIAKEVIKHMSGRSVFTLEHVSFSAKRGKG